MTTSQKARCLCGSVVVTAVGPSFNVRVCHCRLCQKAMGAPFFARAQFKQDALTLEGPIGRFPSSERLDRVFCQRCGTRIGSWLKDGTSAGIALALVDDRNAFTPSEHSWVSEKINWLKIDDGLLQYPEAAPARNRP